MDKCPVCNGRLMVKQGVYQSDEGSTEVYLVQELSCCNKECPNYDKVVDTINHRLDKGV